MSNYPTWKFIIYLLVFGSLGASTAAPVKRVKPISFRDLQMYAEICEAIVPDFGYPSEPQRVIRARATCISNLLICDKNAECLGKYLDKLSQ